MQGFKTVQYPVVVVAQDLRWLLPVDRSVTQRNFVG